MAEYDRDRHSSYLNVFEEADKAMYEIKQSRKEASRSEERGTETSPDSEYIPAIHARKHILIADDVDINREIMGDLLQDEYDLLYASSHPLPKKKLIPQKQYLPQKHLLETN